jgi:hypothetical protein
VAVGDRKRGVATIATAGRILAELERQAGESLPRVVLPGGVTLAHALACIQIVRDLIGGPPKGN